MIDAMEAEMRTLRDSANLFEVSVPSVRLLQQCRREIKMLKQLWDYIFLVRTSIDEWKTTPWKDIDVENMDMECKKFSKVSFGWVFCLFWVASVALHHVWRPPEDRSLF